MRFFLFPSILLVTCALWAVPSSAKKKKKRECRASLSDTGKLASASETRVFLQTERLVLETRTLTHRDLMDFVTDPVILESYYTARDGDALGSLDSQLDQLLSAVESGWDEEGRGEFVLELPIFDRGQNEFVGMFNASISNAHPGVMSVGVAFLPAYRGQGLGVEAIRSFSKYVKATFAEIYTLRAAILRENVASQRLFQRMNFQNTDRVNERGLMIFDRQLR